MGGAARAARLWTLLTLLGATLAFAPPAGAGRAGHLIAYVQSGHRVTLRARPFGRVLARVGPITPFGSARALGVIKMADQGRWLGVTDAVSGSNRIVWADANLPGLRFAGTPLELDVDLSSRTLVVRSEGAVVRRLRVGIGRPGSPTPVGRFAVTDKLNGRAYSDLYGCCILVLSAVQPRLPVGWTGGNRIAIHGTPSASDFGAAVSAGCLHAGARDLRFLMRNVRLGTPVVIRP
jgi:L,D-transpeptidase catalytic domain